MAAAVVVASYLVSAPASALVIDVTSTSATAGTSTSSLVGGSSDSGPTSADTAYADSAFDMAATASVPGGHLGASAVNSASSGTALAEASVAMVLAIGDVTAGDFIQLQTVLSGSFAPVLGDGGTVSLYLQRNSDPLETSAISCSYFKELNGGTACASQIYGQAVQNDVTTMIFDVPLIGTDTLSLGWFLQVGAGAGGSASFLNSADFSILLPNGSVVNGDPGGTLFQIAGSGSDTGSGSGSGPVSVPEPDSVSLLAFGLVCLGVRRTRKRASRFASTAA